MASTQTPPITLLALRDEGAELSPDARGHFTPAGSLGALPKAGRWDFSSIFCCS